MLLLLSFAFAADPPTPPVAATADALRRTCDNAQLCDGRCIPWSETCAATVRARVEVMKQEASDAQRIAIICAATPRASSEPNAPVRAVTAHNAFTLCTGERQNELENCKQDPTGRDLMPDAPTSRPPPCGEVLPPEAVAPRAPDERAPAR